MDQSRQLFRAWEKFCKQLPKQRHEEVTKEKPSLGLLWSSVSTAQSTWKDARDNTKLGRVKEVFTHLCETYSAHSSLVSILPNDNYISLLTGSLSAIAQASY